MENTDEIVTKGTNVREKYLVKIVEENAQKGIETDIEFLRKKITVRPLGEMDIEVEGKKVKKVVFSLEIEGEPVDKVYDEDFNFYAVKVKETGNTMLSEALSSKPDVEQEQIKSSIQNLKWNAKTIDELADEKSKTRKEQDETDQEQAKQGETGTEEPQLPGLEEDEMKLTQAQVNRLSGAGPKTSLGNIVDGVTLRERIGLTGSFIQMVDADRLSQWFPDLAIHVTQTTVPLEIYPNGTARVIGEEELEYAGSNGRNEKATVTSRGDIEKRNAVDEFYIRSRGRENDRITVERGENGEMPQSVSYGRENENTQLESVHEGPLEQDEDTSRHQADTSQGTEKGKVSRKDVEKYARATGRFYVFDGQGNVIGMDLEAAEQEILEDGRPVDQMIDELDVRVLGPQEDPRRV